MSFRKAVAVGLIMACAAIVAPAGATQLQGDARAEVLRVRPEAASIPI